MSGVKELVLELEPELDEKESLLAADELPDPLSFPELPLDPLPLLDSPPLAGPLELSCDEPPPPLPCSKGDQ